jgi:hypothetical protein
MNLSLNCLYCLYISSLVIFTISVFVPSVLAKADSCELAGEVSRYVSFTSL